MTKARDIADIAGAVSNGKIAASDVNVSFVNIADTGTEGTKVATGTTAQRGSTTGQFRFNSTLGVAEYYDGSNFKAIDSAPVITALNNALPTSTAIAAGLNLTISGSGFSSATVKVIDSAGTETSATIVSQNTSSIVFTVPTSLNAGQEPFDLKVINGSGLSTTSEDVFNIDETPAFTTAAGSLGTLGSATGLNASDLTTSTIAASDDEGQSLTFTLSGGTSLPSGLSLATNGAITGSISNPTSASTNNFTVQVSDGNNTATRNFSIALTAPAFLTATGGTTSTSGDYKYHVFTSNGTFTVSALGTDSTYGNKVDYLIVAGGGGGGGHVGSGGGAGGMRSTNSQDITVTAQGYSIVIGSGSGGSSGNGSKGSDSSAFSITSEGGGFGAGGYTTSGGSGGSGGGGGHGPSSSSGGSGTSGQGNSGGTGYHSGTVMGGGGGGKGGAGSPGNGTPHGGAGAQWDVGPDTNYYAGGGGGGGVSGTGGNGGTGGGGGGASQNGPDGSGGGSARNSGGNASGNVGGAAGAETGSGGGAGGHPSGPGGSGGAGIVIVRYKYQ